MKCRERTKHRKDEAQKICEAEECARVKEDRGGEFEKKEKKRINGSIMYLHIGSNSFFYAGPTAYGRSF